MSKERNDKFQGTIAGTPDLAKSLTHRDRPLGLVPCPEPHGRPGGSASNSNTALTPCAHFLSRGPPILRG